MRLSRSRVFLAIFISVTAIVSALIGAPGGGAGNANSALLLADGTVWTAGQNYNGEVGDGTSQPRLSRVPVFSGAAQIAVGASHVLVSTSSGSLYAWGHGMLGQLGENLQAVRTSPTAIPGLTGIIDVAAGSTSA